MKELRLGIFLVMQNPISIEGVTNSEFLRTAINASHEKTIGLYDFIKELKRKSKDLEWIKI